MPRLLAGFPLNPEPAANFPFLSDVLLSSPPEAAALSADRHPRRNIAATRDSLDSDV